MDKQTLLDSFFSTISKMKRLMEQQSDLTADHRITTMLQFHTLSFLANHPHTSPKILGDLLCLSSSSVAQLIDRLLDANWIERQPDEQDRRVVHLQLTKMGEEQLAKLKEQRTKRMQPILKHLSKDDLSELVRIMTKVSTALEIEMKGAQK